MCRTGNYARAVLHPPTLIMVMALALGVFSSSATSADLEFQVVDGQVLGPNLEFSGEEVSVEVVENSYISGEYMLVITLPPERAAEFERLTANNVGKYIRLSIGGTVVSEPKVAEAIAGGEIAVTGPFTKRQAEKLANQLR
ncbi:hypothetical protein [Hoeflea sp. TYP-13]|uniref:SecDF P1 head subdomain-containing protein n=1 Tax=Hoeflea sp. TYP-13 TaxID=3230023 RepID=UPI0034C691F8